MNSFIRNKCYIFTRLSCSCSHWSGERFDIVLVKQVEKDEFDLVIYIGKYRSRVELTASNSSTNLGSLRRLVSSCFIPSGKSDSCIVFWASLIKLWRSSLAGCSLEKGFIKCIYSYVRTKVYKWMIIPKQMLSRTQQWLEGCKSSCRWVE